MATKAPAAPQDDFNLDDIKLDDFPMEDNALFADLDNEMRADGGAGKSAGGDLDLNLDLDGGSGDSRPALEEPGEMKFDDTLDLDLSLDEAPPAAAGGGDLDLDLNLEEPGAEPQGQGGAADLDLNLDLDEGGKTGDADLQLDGDLDLNLEAPEAPAAEASAGGDVELDLDMGSLDLNLDDSAAAGGDTLSLDEPGTPSFSMTEPSEPTFDMDLPEEPGLSLESAAPAEEEPEGLSLSVVGPEAPEMQAPDLEPDLELPELPAEPPAMAAAEPEMDLTLDDGFSLDTIPAASGKGDDHEAAQDFQAAPDINLDDIDLSLETSGAEAPELEPMGAQVNFEAADLSAPTMEEGFDLPPLAETKGDVDNEPAEPFVAVPDVKLTEDEVLELNLRHAGADSAQPEFTMAPEPLALGMGGGDGEFRLTEPLHMAAPGAGMSMGAPAASMGMDAPRMAAPAMSPSMSPGLGRAPRPAREAAVSQDILLTIPHKISVQMGQVNLIGKDIRNLAYGSVVQLNRTVGEPVDLLLDGRSIAQGEIVLINGKNLGVRILALNK
jgi:flagellar motor switch/type III secretory pathway protein FliN